MSSMSLEKRQGVGILTMNRPKVNALEISFVEELDKMMQQLASEQDLRALIITSALPVFMAGADLKRVIEAIETGDFSRIVEYGRSLRKVFCTLEALAFPTIAAINGHALGGGCELSLCCDFRFMSNNGARIGLTEVKLGLLPGAGGTQRLSRLLGPHQAYRLIVTATPLYSEEAMRIGLVDVSCKDDDLMKKSTELAQELAQRPPLAMKAAKKAVWKGMELPLEKGLDLETELAASLRKTQDFKEGVAAFLEKRNPVFKGR